MKIVVFSDVHGSLSSLQAAFSAEDFKSADKKIFLGDVCIGCGRPDECIEFLRKSDTICLLGNNDLYVCGKIPLVEVNKSTKEKLEQIDFMKGLVSEENKTFVMSWQKDLIISLGGKQLYFTHYPWASFSFEKNVIDPPSIKNGETRAEMFKDIQADYYFFGHEHKSNCFEKDGKFYYCIGTLGLKTPGSYLVITDENGTINIEEKFVEFDINHEIEIMDNLGYPYDKNKIHRV